MKLILKAAKFEVRQVQLNAAFYLITCHK